MKNKSKKLKREALTWTNKKLRLRDLAPWPRNPRRIDDKQTGLLKESFNEFGQVETIAVGPQSAEGKYPVYNGHQRLGMLLERGESYEVECRVSSRPLTEKEREKLTVLLHKGTTGEWDFDVLLAEFDQNELMNWGFGIAELKIFDNLSLEEPPEDYSDIPDEKIKRYKSKIIVTFYESDSSEVLAVLEELRRKLNGFNYIS